MTFEEFINRKLDLDEQAYKIDAKIQLLRAQAEKSTSTVSLAPGGNAYDDSRLEELVLNLRYGNFKVIGKAIANRLRKTFGR